MNESHPGRTKGLSAAILGCAALFMAACSSDSEDTLSSTVNSTEAVSLSSTTAAPYTTQAAAPTTAAKPTDAVTDPGYNIEWRIRQVTYGDNGGAVFYMNLKNLNTVPLPPDALPTPQLTVLGTTQTSPAPVSLLSDPTTSSSTSATTTTDQLTAPTPVHLHSGLDLPLGPGATTTVVYTFNTTVASLSNAQLTIGNVSWMGRLAQ
ncbi:MAG: hypothetical protein Q3962_05545 [Corynebacterium sp.]|nr:hypothetical protein [Corynebacterium sp.]